MPKNEFWGQNFKNRSPDSESALPRYHACQFSVKTDNFDFFCPNLPKEEIRIEIHKTNVEITINTFRYQVYQFSDKTDNFEFFGPNLPKNEFWGQNFKNLRLDSESPSLRCCVHQFSDKKDNFEFLDPKIWMWNQHL